MEERKLCAEAKIDGKTFTEFALFDVLRRQKRWLRPLVFAAIFTAFSLLAFSRQGKADHAALLGGVLLAVGLALPLGYLLSFFLSVRRQSRALDSQKTAYTLTLGEDGLSVALGKKQQRTPWEALYAAYRLKNSLCLYTDAQHAFLLPRACGEETFEAAWRLIEEKTAGGKRRG